MEILFFKLLKSLYPLGLKWWSQREFRPQPAVLGTAALNVELWDRV